MKINYELWGIGASNLTSMNSNGHFEINTIAGAYIRLKEK